MKIPQELIEKNYLFININKILHKPNKKHILTKAIKTKFSNHSACAFFFYIYKKSDGELVKSNYKSFNLKEENLESFLAQQVDIFLEEIDFYIKNQSDYEVQICLLDKKNKHTKELKSIFVHTDLVSSKLYKYSLNLSKNIIKFSPIILALFFTLFLISTKDHLNFYGISNNLISFENLSFSVYAFIIDHIMKIFISIFFISFISIFFHAVIKGKVLWEWKRYINLLYINIMLNSIVIFLFIAIIGDSFLKDDFRKLSNKAGFTLRATNMHLKNSIYPSFNEITFNNSEKSKIVLIMGISDNIIHYFDQKDIDYQIGKLNIKNSICKPDTDKEKMLKLLYGMRKTKLFYNYNYAKVHISNLASSIKPISLNSVICK